MQSDMKLIETHYFVTCAQAFAPEIGEIGLFLPENGSTFSPGYV